MSNPRILSWHKRWRTWGWRPWAVPAIGLALALGAIATTVLLQQKEHESRTAGHDLQTVKLELSKLQSAPFQAHASTGGNPALAAGLMRENRALISETLENLDGRDRPPALDGIGVLLRENGAQLDRIYALGASDVGYGAEADRLAGESRASEAVIDGMLDKADAVYGERANQAAARSTFGGIGVIVVLFAAFAFFHGRSVRIARANKEILHATREESLTDALTGLRNRRALTNDLDTAVAGAGTGSASMLVLFDLDGFKHYNDTFGHPAGDSLLLRLGEQLGRAADDAGTAYRMGGDEFCVLARIDLLAAGKVAADGVAALTERGKGFEVSCSYGTALIPSEAADAENALRLADGRMYAHKAGQDSAARQSSDVPLRVLIERDATLSEHPGGVAALAERVALELGLSVPEAKRVRVGAQLHDVGKTGIPDAILDRTEPLDQSEMTFMKRHTLIGERILRAAPALAPSAGLVRSSHERMDGTGYPDGLGGQSIPLGARIIFVCDALNAMTSERAYREATPVPEALQELRRCAGTQFDPRVVDAVCDLVDGGDFLADTDDSPVAVPA